MDNPPAGSLEHASALLRIMGHFIEAAIKRRNLVRELKSLSILDPMTKLGNRNAMDQYIADIQQSNM